MYIFINGLGKQENMLKSTCLNGCNGLERKQIVTG